MSKIEARTLRGFRDYLPETMVPRQRMLGAIEGTFHRFGFLPLMTPALEYLEILQGKYGEEGDTLLYSFRTRGGREVALRYDLTVPLARVVAQHGDLVMPFRRYQIAPVWRAERPQRGRFREFVQCDGDIVGSKDMIADGEILELACALLDDLGVRNYAVRVNNRKVLTGLLERVGVEGRPAETSVLRTIDKLPKIGREETEELLRVDAGLSPEQIEGLFELLSIEGENAAVLRRLETFFDDGSIGSEGAEELRRLFEIISATGAEKSVTVDLSIARGLDYYTGTIYEVFLQDLPGYGAVMAGGRYDGLIGVFKGRDVPAVGVSLGIDRLLQGLVELELLEEARSVARVLVAVFDEARAPESARVARSLRSAGVACDLYPEVTKLGKQFRYAERTGMGWVVVIGPDEIAAGKVSVKDLETGRQEPIRREELVAYLEERVR